MLRACSLPPAEDADALIDAIVAAGMKPGVSVKPGTPVEAILPLCARLHMALVMTVEPGFGGQSFMPEMLGKVKALREAFPHLHVQVDGGLGLQNIDAAAEAGECTGAAALHAGSWSPSVRAPSHPIPCHPIPFPLLRLQAPT